MTYFIQFWSLNLPQETDKKLCLIDFPTCWSVLSSKFCNMLMCATICPQGSGFSSESKVKEKYSGYSWYRVYTSVCVIYGAVDEEDVERYQIGLALEIKPPQGFSWCPLLPQNTHKFSPQQSTHTSSFQSPSLSFLSLSLPFTHTHTPLPPTNTADSADLPESLSALLLLSLLQSSSPQFPDLTPHSEREKPNLCPHQSSNLCKSSFIIPAPYLLDLSTFCAHEDQRVVLVDIADDGCHFVNGVGEERLATHHLRHAQWRVHVQATKVIVNGQELQWKKLSN